jgi:hypothetical protein
MALIGLNYNYNIPQPSSLKEEYTQKVVDRTSIKGVRHRYWLAEKYKVTMGFTALSPSDFAALRVIFYNFGAGVTYTNGNSGLLFFGYPLVAEDEYLKGNTYLKNMTATIEQA